MADIPAASSLDKQMRARFHELDGYIREVQTTMLKTLEDERAVIAEEEIVIRDKLQQLRTKRDKILAESNLVALSKERSAIARYLNGQTGTRDAH